MAAQVPVNEGRLCPLCFEIVANSAPFCKEVGCPMQDTVEGLDPESAIYPELAKANLLRMRGEYREAESLCIRVLKRFPGNATAHTLLGDIHAEQDDLEQAISWYEMALDLHPESEVDHKKLEAVQKRLSAREAAITAQQLGLPTSAPRAKQFAIAIILIFVLVAVSSFLVGSKVNKGDANSPKVITKPIDISSVENVQTSKVLSSPEIDPEKPAPKRGPDVEGLGPVKEDLQILERIKQTCPDGGQVHSTFFDPRTNTYFLTVQLREPSEAKDLCSRLAVWTFEEFQEAKAINFRAVSSGRSTFFAETTREAFLSYKQSGASNAEQILSNIWTKE